MKVRVGLVLLIPITFLAREAPARKKLVVASDAGFAEPKLSGVEGWPSHLASGDLDGDGTADAVVLSLAHDDGEPATLLAPLLGDGHGRFKAKEGASQFVGDMVDMVALADLDEDGKLDAILPRYREKDIAFLKGKGNGTFAKAVTVKAGRKPVQVTPGDVNGDGHLDVVAAYFDHLQVFLGDGGGGLKGLPAFKVGQAPDGPVVADIDADGKADLYFVLNDENKFVTMRGAGDGTFAAWFSGPSCGSPSYPHAADFDGDGTPDLAYACMGGEEEGVEVRFARKKGAEFTTVDVPASPIENLTVGDFTGDGKMDVASMGRGASISRSTVRLLEGNGKGGFSEVCNGVSATLGDPVAVDTDGDGALDLATTYWTGREPGFVSVWRSPCSR